MGREDMVTRKGNMRVIIICPDSVIIEESEAFDIRIKTAIIR
jgi:hypothetical protein